jgi:hypothetical protein
MMFLELPDARELDVALVRDPTSGDSARWRFLPDFIRDKGRAEAPSNEDPLHGRLTIGEPSVQRLESDDLADDPDLAGYVKSQMQTSSFALVALKATFRAQEKEAFYKAWFQVTLERQDDLASPPVIAWSMAPLQETETTKATRKIAFQPKVKIVSALDLDPGLQVSKEETIERVSAVVQGYYEGQSTPAWEFRRGRTRGIDGVVFLSMVVRVPAGAAARGLVSAEATLRRARLGVIRYRADLADPRLGSFSIL